LNGKGNPLVDCARLPDRGWRCAGCHKKHLRAGYQPILPLPHCARCRPTGVLSWPHSDGEVTEVPAKRDAYELLLIEEADAWFEYLEATTGQTRLRYKEVEPWAWARLSQRLRAIRTKRAKLKPAAAA
jgi:hypothetical protein